jgi:hypothetical protein
LKSIENPYMHTATSGGPDVTVYGFWGAGIQGLNL